MDLQDVTDLLKLHQQDQKHWIRIIVMNQLRQGQREMSFQKVTDLLELVQQDHKH
jgi:hypothetical protein